jgi:hypothetical protein
MEGTPTFQFTESVRTMTSARSVSAWAARNSGRCSLPVSSSPSITTLTFTGRCPRARSQASTAATWTRIPALSSALPRPYSRPSRSVGSNGGLVQAATSPVGCTSWWA